MSNKISQKEAVFNAVTSVVGTIEGKVSLTEDQHGKVIAMIEDGFKNGIIEFKEKASNTEKTTNPKSLRSYVIGLTNNWMRKDTRLNGGEKYSAKNPGSRAFSDDAQLKELRKLRKAVTDSTVISKIDAAIATRQAELTAAKKAVKVQEINKDLIPADVLEALNS